MTEFLITAPDGKKYKVNGDNQAGAVAALKKMLGVQEQVKPAEDVVFQSKDGGRVIRGDGGKLSFTSPAYATNDPEAIARIMEGEVASGVSMSGFDQSTIAQHPIASRAAKFVQGVPFLGEYADEAIGSISPTARDAVRASQNAMDREHPIQSAALGIAGGTAGAAAMALAAAPAVAAAAPASLGGQMIAGATAGGVAGGVEGAVSGYGAGNDGNRLAAAGDRGLIGAGLGVVLGGAAPAAVKGIKNLAEWVKGYDVNVISRTLGINKDAAKAIKAAVASDDFPAAEAALRRAGADAVLADASPGAAQLLDTSVQTSGAAARIGRDAVEARAAKANTRLTGVMDAILGPPEGVKSAARDVSQRTAAIRSSAYNRAYSTAIDYASDQGRAIEAALARVDPATLKSAIGEANDAMRAAGVKNLQIMAEISDAGEVVFREMPNVQQLDEIKKALGTLARDNVDQFGRQTAKGARHGKLATTLRDAISDAVPAYRSAVKLGGDKIAEDQALDLGRKLLLTSTTRENVRGMMDGASNEARAAARTGLRSYIDDTLANVQRTITDPNTDAREAMKAIKDLSSRANREKVVEVLGTRAKALFDTIDEVSAHFELRSAVARNSATASRIAGKEAVDEVTKPGPLGKLMMGEPFQAMQSVVRAITGNSDEAIGARKQALYADIAKALVTKKGPDAEAALKLITGAIQGQPISSANALRIAKALTTGLSLGAYQTGSQSLTKP